MGNNTIKLKVIATRRRSVRIMSSGLENENIIMTQLRKGQSIKIINFSTNTTNYSKSSKTKRVPVGNYNRRKRKQMKESLRQNKIF